MSVNSPDTAPASIRRNGKLASCEPCRKNKTKCGHEQPTCNACIKRGKQPECFYHPAPLSRSRFSLYRNPHMGATTTIGNVANTNSIGINDQHSIARSSIHSSIEDQHMDVTTLASSTLPIIVDATMDISDDGDMAGSGIPAEPVLLQQMLEIISAMANHASGVTVLLEAYYHYIHTHLVPSRFLRAFNNDIQRACQALWDGETYSIQAARKLAISLLASTMIEFSPKTTWSPGTFEEMLTGTQLRWEIVGLWFTIAARSAAYGLGNNNARRADVQIQLETLARHGVACLDIVRKVRSTNTDVQIWLAYEQLKLNVSMRGIRDESVWRMLGDLTSDMYEVGFHRETCLTSNAPLFLVELRRLCWVKCYHSDRLVATHLKRPQRILRRFSDTQMPLDITEVDLFDKDVLERQALDTTYRQSWDSSARWSNFTLTRLGFLLDSLFEELYSYDAINLPGVEDELRSLLERSLALQESLPTHLRYSQECWLRSDVPTVVCCLLIRSKLDFWSLELQIHRCIARHQRWARYAMQIDRGPSLRHNLEYVILHYGLPSAIALTASLDDKKDGADVSPEMPLTRTVQCLHRFTAYLEGAFSHDNQDHAVAAAAAVTINAVLSRALQPLQQRTNAEARQSPVDMTPLLDAEWTGAHWTPMKPEWI